MNPSLNLWVIPILPLAGAAINGFLGKKASRPGVTARRTALQRSSFCVGFVGRSALSRR